MLSVRLTSFGYLHLHGGPPPEADRTEDVRFRLRRDPAAIHGLIDLDARDWPVQQFVLETVGARELLDRLADDLEMLAGPRSVAIGCAGGKYRAPALVYLLAKSLGARGHRVEVEHLHIDLPHVPHVISPPPGY